MTEAPICRQCAQPISRQVCCSFAQWRERKYCNWECRRAYEVAHRHRPPVAERAQTAGRIEDVGFLIDAGESVTEIAGRLGIRVASLARWLDRHGYGEEARECYRHDWLERGRHVQRRRKVLEDYYMSMEEVS